MSLPVHTHRRDWPRWAWLAADVVAICGLIFFALYYLTAFRFDSLFTVTERQVDFKQWYLFPPVIAQHLQYPSVAWKDWTIPFPYIYRLLWRCFCRYPPCHGR